VLIPPNDRYNLAQMLVPLDDVNTMFYWVAWTGSVEGHLAGRVAPLLRRGTGSRPGRELQKKKKFWKNRYLQDRDAMKRGDWTGIQGIPTQDMAMWESMGPITDRSQERPGATISR